MIYPTRHILIEKFSIETALEEYLIGQLMSADIELKYISKQKVIHLPTKSSQIKEVTRINLTPPEDKIIEIYFIHRLTQEEIAVYDLHYNQFCIFQKLFDNNTNFNPTLYNLSIFNKMIKTYNNILIKYLKTNKNSNFFQGIIINKKKLIFNTYIE